MMSLRTARTVAWFLLAVAFLLVLIFPTRPVSIVAGFLALLSAILGWAANTSES